MFSWERKICANTFCGYCTSHWYSSMRGLMFSEQGPIRGPILSLFSCNGIVRNAENPKQLYLAISNYNNYIYCISIYNYISIKSYEHWEFLYKFIFLRVYLKKSKIVSPTKYILYKTLYYILYISSYYARSTNSAFSNFP